MKIQRRALNGYLLSGFAGGTAFGFVAGRYSKDGEPGGARPALETLRGAARQAPGIHLIGLTTKNFDPFDPYAAEEKLLSRIGFSASQLVQDAEFYEALTLAVRRDYLSGDVVEVEKYLLSETEALFVRYALENQGLVDVPEIEAIELDNQIELQVFIEDQEWEYEDAPKELIPIVYFFSSGEVTPFEIEFSHDDVAGETETVHVNVWGTVVWKELQEQLDAEADG